MAPVSIRSLCTAIRSKQAGPFRLTLDMVFRSQEIYEKVKASGTVTARVVADLYKVPEDQITDFVFYDPGWAIKATLIRPIVAGDPGDGDAFGCQQHVPLLGIWLSLDETENRVATQ